MTARDPKEQGAQLRLGVVMGYPGSRVSDLVAGDHVAQVSNDWLEAAEAQGVAVHGGFQQLVDATTAQVLRDMHANRRGTNSRGVAAERRALLAAMLVLGVKP